MTISNPVATGSAGPAFETKVAAACLTLLLTRGSPLFLGTGTLHTVHLQAGHLGLGWNTDDLLLEATDSDGLSMKAAVQVKRSFELGRKDEECVKTLLGALSDFRNEEQFDQRRDAVALVVSSLSATVARGLRTLLDCARASLTADDMDRRLAIPKYLGKPARDYLSAIRDILAHAPGGAPSKNELWQFLCRFHVADFDLNIANGLTETMLRALLSATLPDGDKSTVDATWNELIVIALIDAGGAMSYSRERLPTGILQRHGRSNEFSHGISRLLENSAIVERGIRSDIAGKTTISRCALHGELCELIETSPLVFVTGAAGSGKSALVKNAFGTATQGLVGFAFRAASLAGNHINDVLQGLGLSLSGLQAQTAMHGKKLLWVDSLEQLIEKPPEQRSAFLDLLRALKRDPSWRMVVTCRDYSAETVRTAFFEEAGLTPVDLEVSELGDEELEAVTGDFPSLQRPLCNPSLRRLLRNPFFLDMAAKMNWPENETLPTTERAFREKVWNQVIRRTDVDFETGVPNMRGQGFVDVGLRRAKSLEPFILASDLDSKALVRLVSDSLLQSPSLGSDFYAPSHDVFEDWALMRWLNDAFVKHHRQIEPLFQEIGTYPALRRAYRRWLTESLDADPPVTDSLVMNLIQNPNVASHWREDTLVGVLQSKDAVGFLKRNSAQLVGNGANLLRQIIHILRVACRAAIPRRFFGGDSVGVYFLPKGNGWIGAAQLLASDLSLFTEADLSMIVGFLEDWILLTRYGIRYPEGASSIAKVAWHWLPRIPWRSPLHDGEDRILRVLLAVPMAAEPKLSETISSAISDDSGAILDLIFNHFACDAVVRDLPDLAFVVAEHLLGLDHSLEQAIAQSWSDHWRNREVEYAFGFGWRHLKDDFPASAFHGPYLRMLWHHPSRSVEFIVRMINRAGDAYAHPDNRCEYIEPPGRLTIMLPDGPHEQYANWRLWVAYRGMHGVPHCFESALMALEYWLLEKTRRGDADVENLLMDLLRRSNNVSITAVVASIAAANPALAGEAAFCLLTCRPLLKMDLDRSCMEASHVADDALLSMPAISAETGIYDKERKESARLKHRVQSLEYVAASLQLREAFRDRVWRLIDNYKGELPAEADQDEETKRWRIQLHRIDSRNFIEAGRTNEGHILIGCREPEPDLQMLIVRQKPHSDAFIASMSLLNWGRATLKGKSVGDDWRAHIQRAQAYIPSTIADESDIFAGGPAYVAAVCIRDHWPAMSLDQQDWCAQTVFDAVESDSDVTDYTSIIANSSTKGSRAGAFALSALFDKGLSETTRSRLLTTLSLAVMHAVEETVSYAVQGIAQFLWRSDRALALTCVQALVIWSSERHVFVERQRRRHFSEQESDDSHRVALRKRLREFISNRGAVDEAQIASLDLTRGPGRSVARYLFAIATQNPEDQLSQQVIYRCAAALPTIWNVRERSHNSRPQDSDADERYDSQSEHDIIDAICRFVLQINPCDALALLEPVFLVAKQVPGKVASIVTWLRLYQGDHAPSQTLWTLWQRFAEDFVAYVDVAKVDEEGSSQAKMLRELFLGGNWNEQRDWRPLHGEFRRISDLFVRLPPMEQGFECYAYYLAKIGTPTLPDSLIGLATKLTQSSRAVRLNNVATFYLEEIFTRLIYGGNSRIRTERPLRDATLKILDGLVDAGSSAAYKFRDDFLTPVAS